MRSPQRKRVRLDARLWRKYYTPEYLCAKKVTYREGPFVPRWGRFVLPEAVFIPCGPPFRHANVSVGATFVASSQQRVERLMRNDN
jgi:hypothetical protein